MTYKSQYTKRPGTPTKPNTTDCGVHLVHQSLLETTIDQWLEDTQQSLADLTSAGPDGLIQNLFGAKDARRQLAEIRQQMEVYLRSSLDRIATRKEKRGVVTYAVPLEQDRDVILRFPGQNSPLDIVDTFNWLLAGDRREREQQIARLESDHERLYSLFKDMPSAKMRTKLMLEVQQVENALEALKTVPDLALGHRRLYSQLMDLAKRVAAARKSLQGDVLRRRATAIRTLIERIDVRFVRVPRGQKFIHKPAEIVITPLVPGEAVTFHLGEDGPESSSGGAPHSPGGGPDGESPGDGPTQPGRCLPPEQRWDAASVGSLGCGPFLSRLLTRAYLIAG